MTIQLAAFSVWSIFMAVLIGTLVYWHFDDHRENRDFRLQRFVMSRRKAKPEEWEPDLSKLILVVMLFVTVYVLVKDASDAAGVDSTLVIGVLGIWVLNRAAAIGGNLIASKPEVKK
jgi:hypothetical protein